MAKIKLTKGELKRQRDALGQFRHYLPTLQLKQQQLQMKISEARNALKKVEQDLQVLINNIERWAGLLAESKVDIYEFIKPKDIHTEDINIAGANVPMFKDVTFVDAEYDLYETPLWTDAAIARLRDMVKMIVQADVIKKRIELLARELRVTTQRVNLFEKIKIPECIENIRRIRIYLGDQQANAVGISKVAKAKIEIRESEGAGVA